MIVWLHRASVPKSDVLVITAMSNVLGVSQDVAAICRAARAKNPNVITVVDATQYIVHHKIDVKKWDCDFLVASGHKIGADTGVGILYIRDADYRRSRPRYRVHRRGRRT